MNNEHEVMVYTLSTCVWCKKIKNFLQSLNVQFNYIDVDLSSEEEKKKVRRLTLSYPLTIIDDKIEINGYKEERIREALNL